MCVRVFLAEDVLSECEDITLVGEAATLGEAIQKITELKRDVIVFDLHMAELTAQNSYPLTRRCSQYRWAYDDEAKTLAESIGAANFLDQMNLSQVLIPAIPQLAPVGSEPS